MPKITPEISFSINYLNKLRNNENFLEKSIEPASLLFFFNQFNVY